MRLFALLLSLLLPLGAQAHEFWIEPEAFQLPANAPLRAVLVNGQTFAGQHIAYLPKHFRSFTLTAGGQSAPVQGRAGDAPALNLQNPSEGLQIIAYQSQGEAVTYDDFSKFENFLVHKGYPDLLARHEMRGLPRTGFREFYTRYAKSLVAVGSGAGQDQRQGFALEIVALQNPYRAGPGPLPVQVFYDRLPLAGGLVELYEKRGNAVSVQNFRTDDEGRVSLPLRTGARYLINTVVLREPSPELAAKRNVVWESLWASLTLGFD